MSDSAREAVRDQIEALVLAGELRPGDRLVERRLAERLGVSRVPVREALRQLLHEGLAEERATRGMVVRTLDPDDVEALFEVRSALEEVALARVVEHAGDADLDRLAEVVAEADAAIGRGDPGSARAANARFHAVLLDLAGPVLTAVMEPVAGRMLRLLSQHDDPAAMNDDHRALLAALRDRDAEGARRHGREHLARSRDALAARMSP
jgi:DNA-binding GntR family transcriptional regulator